MKLFFSISFVVVSSKDKLWVKIMHSMEVEMDSFVDRHVDSIMDLIVSGNTLQEVRMLENVSYPKYTKMLREFLLLPSFGDKSSIN